MPAPKTKPNVTTRATKLAKAKTEDDARVIERVAQALEAAQEDLASIGGSLGAGARDLRKDVERMLRDSRRDLKKMSTALQRELERLQKDLTKTIGKNGHVRAGAPPAGKTTRPKARAASR
jgi:DNA repair exonuclease SbcCD ATPase subunit